MRCISAPTCGRRSRCWPASCGIWLGYAWADSAAALAVAVFVLLAGWRLASRTVASADRRGAARRSPNASRPSSRQFPAWSILSACACGAPAPCCSSTSRSRSAGRCRSIASPRSRQRSRAPSRREMPEAEVSVITTPRALDDESVLERVLVIARNRALAVHHVTVHAVGDQLAVSLDLEVDGKLTLAGAHEIADGLEHAIAEELGSGVEVETHIEPLQIGTRPGTTRRPSGLRQCAPARRTRGGAGTPAQNPRRACARNRRRRNRQFPLRRRPRADRRRDRARRVDEVERALRRREWPAIKRVVGHVEPARR